MAEDKAPVFRVNGKDYEIPETFTIGEMCDAERFFGVEFGNEAGSSIRTAAALLWIAVHREDPTISVEQIRGLPPDVFATFSQEADTRPPASTDASKSNNVDSGTSTANGSEGQAVLQQASGVPVSATGVTSDPLTSPNSHPGN
jgi:hypothetical protein